MVFRHKSASNLIYYFLGMHASYACTISQPLATLNIVILKPTTVQWNLYNADTIGPI